ncbi:hypothetical protein PVAND_007040 [Polypedilum vanderplanki]|uniref:DUF4773 domain-containing protein n=1 Tax=Polypedilum vanderplanki TaxID=319348 RepID=A0A9J6C5T6_POLVA|nr:hypothetical protein PVAND_007040 [Polypedilum vanderplanki]
MREICVICLFILIFVTVVNTANLKLDKSDLNITNEDMSNDFEFEFLKNLTQILNESQGRDKKDKNVIKEMLRKPQIPPVTTDPVEAVQSRIPCECKNGICSCCVGGFFFNNKGCMKIKYIPENFAFEFRMMFNGLTLYRNTISGKNPPPICIVPPRFDRFVEMCARFHDIYFVGRNMHLCLDVAVSIVEFEILDREFDCMKFGTDGIALSSTDESHPGYPAVIKPGTDAEIDAGGVDEIDDYDEIVG